MSESNPCCHDCTDFPDEQDTHTGCCAPIPVRLTCEAPVLPVPECDEEDPTIEYDPETEQFFAVGILYDSECSAILDQSNSAILTPIG